jgi:penicillin amidase
MNISRERFLASLGAGMKIEALCRQAGITPAHFEALWREELARRVPASNGSVPAAVRQSVHIDRDAWGIPHVRAANDEDLFFGFGFAAAQDRLFQLDYLRRRACGRLSEILGPDGLELDTLARTVGLHLAPANEWPALPEETRRLALSYTAGVNAHIEQCGNNLPIEFALLDYRPEPWRPEDCLAIAQEFRWYLTGRFPVIVIPELAKRALGTGPLYDAFLAAEADEESILHPGDYPRAELPVTAGQHFCDPFEGQGSNNWVVAGSRSKSGKPLLASDPHIAFAAVSCWHEVRLSGGSFEVAGMAYAGIPAVMFGRNANVAWGITNNICSLRDLYQEKTDPAHPGCFLYDGRWEPARRTTEVIVVKGQRDLPLEVTHSRNGPIVDQILPAPARHTGPVSLRWLGRASCGWLAALLNIDRAGTVRELREATRPWLVPTFCVVCADTQGSIGYQCTGRIPVRAVRERGYRPGWDPAHQWQGLIPFEDMPSLENPQRGYIATANNRVADDDFHYPLSGTWPSGYRARRIRQMIEQRDRHDRQDFARMQLDVLSLRALDALPGLLALLDDHPNPKTREAANCLAQWNGCVEPQSAAPAIFNVFFTRWCERVAERRFEGEVAALLSTANAGLALNLLHGNAAGWFTDDAERRRAILESFSAALADLERKLGPNLAGWQWGALHTLQQKHFLSDRGDLGTLLDRGGVPVRGDYLTVCNTGLAPDFSAPTGAGYRMTADLAEPALWAIDAGSQSGNPGSPHYADQLAEWQAGRQHRLPMGQPAEAQATLTLRAP